MPNRVTSYDTVTRSCDLNLWLLVG